MGIGRKKGALVAAVSAVTACILQIIGLILYVGRLPEDWVGIGLYGATIFAFAL